jgi:hypothetical protein
MSTDHFSMKRSSQLILLFLLKSFQVMLVRIVSVITHQVHNGKKLPWDQNGHNRLTHYVLLSFVE